MAREMRVGEWLVEPDLNRISRQGTHVSIEPKVVDVLLCLADHPGEVLCREKLIQTVWPDTFVSEEVLSYSISELRKAFVDDAKNPHIIQTIPRRGYRLIAPVVRMGPPPGPQPSIAVLAFSDISPEKDQEYFCDGIADEVITSLSRLKGLRVVARTSSFSFKGKSEDMRTIGRKLGVDTASLDPYDPYIIYGIACFYSRLGKSEEALDFFEQAVRTGFTQKEWIDNDSDFDSIRTHPRFQSVLKALEVEDRGSLPT